MTKFRKIKALKPKENELDRFIGKTLKCMWT
jgi:hypothetical protein